MIVHGRLGDFEGRSSVEKAEAVRLLHTILDEMDDHRREVFVMAELEQMWMPDIAATLDVNVNTVFALCASGRAAEARAAATGIVAGSPRSPLAAQVRRSCQPSSSTDR